MEGYTEVSRYAVCKVDFLIAVWIMARAVVAYVVQDIVHGVMSGIMWMDECDGVTRM